MNEDMKEINKLRGEIEIPVNHRLYRIKPNLKLINAIEEAFDCSLIDLLQRTEEKHLRVSEVAKLLGVVLQSHHTPPTEKELDKTLEDKGMVFYIPILSRVLVPYILGKAVLPPLTEEKTEDRGNGDTDTGEDKAPAAATS